MQCRDILRREARSETKNRSAARQIAMDIRRECATARRLSSDLRFIRRNRQDGVVPKTYREIVFDETSNESIIFKTDDNAIIVFGSVELIVAASTTKFICADGTFGRCPKTHYQLITCHSMCHDGFSFPFAFALLQNKKRHCIKPSSTNSTRRH